MLFLSLLLGTAWGYVFMAYSSYIKEEGDMLVLAMRFIVAPMFMFSGTFYELKNMPELVQTIAWFSPLWHGTELARSISYGSPDPYTFWHYVILAAYGIIGALFAYPQFMKRLSR
jgi:lipooligosaccharide transport system permease protein